MLLDLGPVLARRRNAEAGDALVAFAVGQADDRELLDPRRGAVDLLQLVGVDVLAAGVEDQILLPPDERQVAVLVEPSKVAGAQPAAGQHLARRLRVVEIARHHVRALCEYLADAVGVRVLDPDLDAGQRWPHGPGAQPVLRHRH